MLRTSGLGAGALSAVGLINDWTVEFLPVQVTTIFMAIAGAFLAFSYTDESAAKIPRKKMYTLAITNAIFTIAAVSFFPQMFGWDWFSTKVEGTVALMMAGAARFVVPLFLKKLPELWDKWFGLGDYKKVKAVEEEVVEPYEQEEYVAPKKAARKRTNAKKA